MAHDRAKFRNSVEKSRASTITAVPVLDLGPFLAGKPGSAEVLAASLREAASTVGFYYVANHGVPQKLVDATFEAAEHFHALPLEEKLELKVTDDNQGYMPLRGSTHRTSDGLKMDSTDTKPNVNEAFFVRRECEPDHPKKGLRYHKENRWPKDLSGFRETVVTYFNALQDLGRRLLPVYALALDLPATYFDIYFSDPISALRLTHYPPITSGTDEFSIAPHFDSSFMTILAQNKVPGLQILDYRTKEWIDVGIIEGTFIVNIGEVLRRLTNGLFLATPHRAYNLSGTDRYAIPYFLHPDAETMLEPLETGLVPHDEPDFPIQTTTEYLQWFASKNYDHSRPEKQSA